MWKRKSEKTHVRDGETKGERGSLTTERGRRQRWRVMEWGAILDKVVREALDD